VSGVTPGCDFDAQAPRSKCAHQEPQSFKMDYCLELPGYPNC
jgi:hypothetical protein